MGVLDSITGSASQLVNSATNSVASLANPTNARNAISGLLSGGGSMSSLFSQTSIGFKSAGGTVAADSDWRVRVSLSTSNAIFYNDSTNTMMKPLTETNGVIFPYTPTVNLSHTATYNPQQLAHSNYALQFYQGSEVSDITIQGEFTVQNQTEGQYLLAAIYFFRSASKMFFGLDEQTGGNPPPIVYLDGYGEHYFPHVPCVLTSFSHTMPNDADYIEIPVTTTSLVETTNTPMTDVTNPMVGGNYGTVDLATNSITGSNGETYAPNFNATVTDQAALATAQAAAATTSYSYSTSTKTTRLPTISTVSINLRPVYSRKSLHDQFTLKDFAAGRLVKGNGGYI